MAAETHRYDGVSNPELMVVEAGPKYLERIPAPAIIVLPQVRKTMEQEPLTDLKASIGRVDEAGRLHLDLLNPLLIADLDATQAAAYLADVNLFWGTNFSLDAMAPNPLTDRYAFLISGHRRLRAIAELAAEHEVSFDRIHITTSPHRDITFQEALILQLKENTYHAPDPTELAEAIRLSWDFMRLDNPRLTQAQCAAELGFTPSRISRALAYSDLPGEVKGCVKTKDMSFNLAVMLGRVQDEYRRRYDRMRRENMLADDDPFTNAEEYAAYEIQTFANRLYALLQRSRRSAGQAMDWATGQLNTLRLQREAEQQPFDLLTQVEPARRRRRLAVGALATFAMHGLAAAVRQDDEALQQALAADPQTAQMLEAALRRHSELMGVNADPMF